MKLTVEHLDIIKDTMTYKINTILNKLQNTVNSTDDLKFITDVSAYLDKIHKDIENVS